MTVSIEKKININSFFDASRINGKPYPGKETVLSYLRNGRVFCASPGWDTDPISGNRIPGEKLVYENDFFVWGSDLIYFIEMYNFRLPHEIESRILSLVA